MTVNILPEGAAQAQFRTLTDLTVDGDRVDGADDPRGASRELLAYTTGMSEPLQRIAILPVPLNVLGAVARFVWLLAGSDRLEDIAYYEPRVRDYTDDQLSVPGSSYGRRLLNAAPGTNQISGVVAELKRNPGSRRAAAVVWLPEDAVRSSKDIPCTFGLFFHIRGGGLVMTTVMRSNNAAQLFPYNFFEFSMLGEMVANELGVPFERYVHWSASMHTFDRMAMATNRILKGAAPESARMPPMPAGTALAKGYALARHEAKMRHAESVDALMALAEAAHEELGAYWSDLYDVLLAYGLAKRGERPLAVTTLAALPPYLGAGATKSVIDILGPDPVPMGDDDDPLFSVDELGVEQRASAAALVANSTFAAGTGITEWLLQVLSPMSTPDTPVTLDDIFQIQADLTQGDVALAARGSDDSSELSQQQVKQALDRVRHNRGLS